MKAETEDEKDRSFEADRDSTDRWMAAVRAGDLKSCQNTLRTRPSIVNTFTEVDDGVSHYRTNAITEASFQGNRDLVKWLIDNNADVNSVSDGGWRPIHFAAQHGHVTTVNLLVLGGAEVNVKTETNETPILLALQSYMRDTVKKLMYHGASIIGIDRNYLHMCIQKDVLDPSCLDDENKTYMSDSSYSKTDINGYDVMIRQPEKEFEEIKINKIIKNKLVTEYDNDLKRRRQELIKKMRRTNEQGLLIILIRKISLSDNDAERINFASEALSLLNTQDNQIPQTKTSDHLINLLELSVCDSDSSEQFIRIAGNLMMNILQHNIRRGESAVVDFWCRIFDKMSNLQIEQYTSKILEMLIYMIESANETVIINFKNNRESFLKTWEYFFENLCFPKCLNGSLLVLKLVKLHVPESVNYRFHNVIDIMIGWCIHPDTDIATLESLRSRSADLHECWISDINNLKKTILNLQKDIINQCQLLSRIHRLDKDRSQVDDMRLKIRYFCFALSCVSAGVSGIADVSDLKCILNNSIEQPLSIAFIVNIIEKLGESLVMCSKQIDFDNLLLQSNTIILHLLSCLVAVHDQTLTVYTAVLRYIFGTSHPLQSRTITEGSVNINYNTKELLASNLDLIYICCNTQGILESSMVVQIFTPVNWIHSCLFYGETVHRELMLRFLRIVDIVIKSPAMSTFYQILLSDLELSMNTLMKLSNSCKQIHLVQTNAFKSKVYDSNQAEIVVKYNINMMIMLHRKAKDSAQLVPLVPVLLLKYLSFSDRDVVEKYPETSIFILEAISFLEISKDLTIDFVKCICFFLNVANVDIIHKRKVFQMLQTCLPNLNNDNKLMSTVLETVVNFTFMGSSEEDNIYQCLKIVLTILRVHIKDNIIDDTVKSKTKEMTVKFIMHISSNIRLISLQIYYYLLSNDESPTINDTVKRIQSISLRGRSFKYPLDFSKTIFHWIINISEDTSFRSSDVMRLYDLITVNSGSNDVRNRMVMLYEIIINACWDCVRQKLKFDQNADSKITLMTIENIVKSILTNGNSLRSVNDSRFRKMMSVFTTKSIIDQTLSVNLLILLLDSVEKMFYNSYEGCSVGMPGVNKTTENFFVTNRHVCSEWFLKMRLMIVALAQYAGQWSTVVWHGMQLLNHHLKGIDDCQDSIVVTKSLFPEMEDCIVFTSMALSKLGNWEALLGLSQLAIRVYGKKFNWIVALADKTMGHIEMALDKFEEYVMINHDPERLMKQSPEYRLLTRKITGHSSFILCMEEIADCHRLLANVEEIDKWSKQMYTWKSDTTMLEAHKSSINWNRLSCLAKLSKWDECTDVKYTPIQQSKFTWKHRSVTDYCEDILFASALEKSTEKLLQVEKLTTQLSSLQSVCDFPLALSSPEIILINERCKCLRWASESKNVVIDSNNLSRFSPTLPLSVINFCNVLQKSFKTEDCFTNQKYLIQWHRNLKNYKKCDSLIKQCFFNFLKLDKCNSTSLNTSKAPIIQMQLERQTIKLLWVTEQKKNAVELLTNSLKESLLFETSDLSVHASKCRLNTKSILTLFQWLSNDKATFSTFSNGIISSNLQFLIELAEVPWINGLPLVSPQQRSHDKPCQSSVTDVCGQLLILASKSKNQDNNNDKSFMTLAQWCLSRSKFLDEEGFSNNNLDTIGDDLEKVGFSKEEANKVTQCFKLLFQPAQMASDNDWLGFCYDDDNFLNELKLSVYSCCPNISDQMMSDCLTQWKNCICRHFSLHIAASDAYFSFLKDVKPELTNNSVCNKNKTTANLRILSLLGKRSRSLRDSIISKIKTSPPGAWINVIPQLFARIKHPDNSIRTSVMELLQRFALFDCNRSSLIIYPTIVGTLNEDIKTTISPCHEIRKVLVAKNAKLVFEVELFIKELRRITVLWDELWIASLNQCYEELNKKSAQLQSEIEKISKDECSNKYCDVILGLKYNSIIQPALFILDRVKAATNVTPETPRELWFFNTFDEEIKSTINSIKSPQNIYEFKDSWKKVKELQELMVTESNDNSKTKVRQGRHQFLSLKLNEISPSLANIYNSCIPIPGMEDVELVSIDCHISILPTKTKPKKLQFVASNGQKYSYLYKGLEDLRLDERIMQILGIANTMFSKLNERESNKYHITTYNVTPLGPRAGLIQMVEDATSLFTLYKRHQMRSKNTNDALKSRFKSVVNASTDDATVISEEGHPIRPTDIYWQKLRPKLDLAKLDFGFDNREKWPSSILIEVLNELKRETPSDLLSRELWCCSINSSNWFRSSISFTRSCAVMSIMGNIIGLGDRHLDNLLVNLSTGQIVHIDYNVCFDKGSSLKVPEKVPFRLTDIMTDVFGPAGVEGLFKVSCENVMMMVQQTQDNILTLMDTFVLDPIVDWSSGIESGHYGSYDGGKFVINSLRSVVEKRCVEFIIGFNNFQSVLVTMEEELKCSNDNIVNELDILHSVVEKNLEISIKINNVKNLCQKRNEMIDYLDTYENNNYCDILDHVNYVKSIESSSSNITSDLEKRLKQMNVTVTEHASFFNMILSNSDFISFKLDVKNLSSFFDDNMNNVEKSMKIYLDMLSEEDQSSYSRILTDFRSVSPSILCMQDCTNVFERYRNLLHEMPENYFTSDRCSYMLNVTKDLIEDRSVITFNKHTEDYSSKWINGPNHNELYHLTNERNNWHLLLTQQSHFVQDLKGKMPAQSIDEEIKQLESIWQLTMYENMGINVFKAVLLEQYLEMANIASQIDSNIAKIPEQVSLSVDYNDTIRKYLQLLNSHDNYFKILSNCMNVFGIYLSINEAASVCGMITSLQKVCTGVASFESNFIDIIMPEAIKIMKNVSTEDDDVLNDLQLIGKESENVLLHFNIALTSASYDINNYESIHSKVVIPLKEKIVKLTTITTTPIHQSSKLRVLIASFYTTIYKTYSIVCDFIDSCINSSTPSAWNYLDLVVASGLNISPMWNKSHKLLKDALYMTSIRALINTVEYCLTISNTLISETSAVELNNIFNNMLHHVEIYFNFINRHILAGVGSQCFGKMFCLLLEFAGWNLDAMIAENIHNCPINAEYICGSISSFRKTEYPNAMNFYTQLQFRFNNYKTLTGFTAEPNLSLRFLSRNISFHKSLYKLARNQLISLCWIRKDVLDVSTITSEELSLVIDLQKTLDDIPDRLSLVRGVLSRVEMLESDLKEIDLKVQSSMNDKEAASFSEVQNNMISERSTMFANLRSRLYMLYEGIMNMDRFECLRSKSKRAREFDEEILQFFGDTEHLLEELNHCSGMIKPIEEEIITCMGLYDLDLTTWWIDLKNALKRDVLKDVNEQNMQNEILKDIKVMYDQQLRHLKVVLNNYYHPLINHLKPSLRVLHSITRKLKSYLSNNDFSLLQNHSMIKSQFGYICKLLSLFERFNSAVDSIINAISRDDCDTLIFIDRLNEDFINISSLKNDIGPELFKVFRLLSPVNDIDDNIDTESLSMFGFSNNSMAEIKSENLVRMSPTFSNEDDVLLERALGNIEQDSEYHIPDTYVGDRKYINNSTGVQRAVEVWRLVESRINMVTAPQKSKEVVESDEKVKRETINQYVDKCIRTARNPDNLARMYEGWTAWV